MVYLLAPLLGGAVLVGLCNRFDWFPALARPLDRGCQFRGQPLLGPNKTVRGLVAVIVGNMTVLVLQCDLVHRLGGHSLELFDYGRVNGWLLGLALGTAVGLAELPNSFLKRRRSIAAGQRGSRVQGAVFYFLDQVDVIAGVWLVMAWVVPVTAVRVIVSVAVLFVLHQVVSVSGYALGLRRTLT